MAAEPEPEPEAEAGPKVFDEDSHPREWILFEQIDINGDHVLQKEEVEKHFERLGLPTVAGELLKELDKNNDGQIDFEEFVAGYGMFKKMMNRQWEAYEASSPKGGVVFDPLGGESAPEATDAGGATLT